MRSVRHRGSGRAVGGIYRLCENQGDDLQDFDDGQLTDRPLPRCRTDLIHTL